jgi:glycine/D-amino acid oxidase-like deaminating enzyme
MAYFMQSAFRAPGGRDISWQKIGASREAAARAAGRAAAKMAISAKHRRKQRVMGPPVDPVATDVDLPTKVAVVIIGGGIIGTCAALFLARKGVTVALCEKGHIGAEQSSRNWGWCRKQGRDAREMPLIIEALRLWEAMNELTGSETGFRSTGVLYVCDSEEELARREAWLAVARPHQLDTRIVGTRELAELMKGAARHYRGALYTKSDGRAEPQKAAPAIAHAARKLGAKILTQCAVRGVETAGGRVAAVITENGRIGCDSVVLAGGAWSSLFCHSLNMRLPQLKIRSSALRTTSVEGGPTVSGWTSEFSYRKRLDGGYLIASTDKTRADLVPDSFKFFVDFLPILRLEWRSLRFHLGPRFLEEWRHARALPLDQRSAYERDRVLDPEPKLVDTDRAFEQFKAVFPACAEARIEQRWAGFIDVTPDAVPVISPVEQVPGFFVATGFSGHGFGIGPGAGRLIADLVTGDPPIVDPWAFRFSRFTDGSRPQPEASI